MSSAPIAAAHARVIALARRVLIVEAEAVIEAAAAAHGIFFQRAAELAGRHQSEPPAEPD